MLSKIIAIILSPFIKLYYMIKYSAVRKRLSAAKRSSTTRHFIERIIEVIVVEMFVSALGALLYFTGAFKSFKIVFFVSLAETVILLGWNVYCLYAFRLYIVGKKYYLLFNLPVYGALFLAAIITGCFRTEPYYTFIFMPFKLFYYAAKVWSFPGAGHIDRPAAAVMMSLVISIPLALMPLIIDSHRKKMLTKDNENNEGN
ncbi:MAG: hypothetical protein IJT91_04960 [Clostridia bacterium]|nr:hypothetical protein [Clostridia bacterium]